MPPIHKWRAKLTSEDRETIAIRDVLDSYGLQVCSSMIRNSNLIPTISYLYVLYRVQGAPLLKQTIETIMYIYDDDDHRWVHPVMPSVANFILKYPDFDPDRLKHAMRRKLPLAEFFIADVKNYHRAFYGRDFPNKSTKDSQNSGIQVFLREYNRPRHDHEFGRNSRLKEN